MIKKIYDKIELNLGIKTFFEKIVEKTVYFIDKTSGEIIFKINQFLTQLLIRKINRHYGAAYYWKNEKSQNLNLSNNNLGYGGFHYNLIRNQKPKNILCIGSMYGFIPFMMAKACEQNGKGTVHFVDASYDMNDDQHDGKHFFGQGFWKEVNLEKHFSYLLDNDFIKTHIMTSEEFYQKNKDLKFDYVYLDGDHSYQGAKKDITNFWPQLNEDGFLCMHDLHYKGTDFGVKFEFYKIWENLADYPYKFQLSNHYSGLGFLQKLGTKNPADLL